MALPKQFQKNYLTQQMAMKIGRQTSRNDYYYPEENEKHIRGLLIKLIELESGRGFPDVVKYIKDLDITEFMQKCRKFAK